MPVSSKSILTRLTVRQLPLPGTALACHVMRQKGTASVGDVVRVLSTDPISALSILRKANGAYYGLQGTINSLTHAVEVLGTDQVTRQMSIDQSPVPFNIPLHLVIQHGYVTAQIAHRIAGGTWPFLTQNSSMVGGVFTAGLLHNIGRLAACITYPQETCRMYGYDRDSFPVKGTLQELERLQFGADYVEIGTFIAQKFRLPTDLADVIKHHANPDSVSQSSASHRLVMTVNAASEIASSLGYGMDPQGSLVHEHSTVGLQWLEKEQPGCFLNILNESHDSLAQLDVFDFSNAPFRYQEDRQPVEHATVIAAQTSSKTTISSASVTA